MEKFDIDAYVPAQMAGLFIGLGAVFFTFVIHDSTMSAGLIKLIGGYHDISVGHLSGNGRSSHPPFSDY